MSSVKREHAGLHLPWGEGRGRVVVGIAVAGAAGSLARYGVQQAVMATPSHVPFGVLLVNVTGCLLAGVLLGVFRRRVVSLPARAVLLAGLVASYTTFSTYAVGTVTLVSRHDVLAGVAYCLFSLLACVASLSLGIFLASRLAGERGGGSERLLDPAGHTSGAAVSSEPS